MSVADQAQREQAGTVELDDVLWKRAVQLVSDTCLYPGAVVERFWPKVQICVHGTDCHSCCWEWQAGKTRGGYGNFGIPKAFRAGTAKCERANRVCWRIVHGAIPEGLDVLHNCPEGDNPSCVSPWHLWVGTKDDNQKDSMRKGRRPTGNRHGLRLHPEAVQRGERNPAAQLTIAEIYAIRALKGSASQRVVAAQFGVSRSLIGLIWQYKVWGWLREGHEEVTS